MVLLKDIILILFLAIVIILILSRLKIPPVIGFLLTGVIIGPSALQLVQSVAEIELLAEIGIILLMFSIGLEFSLDKIRRMLKDFLFFGGFQVVSSWLVFTLLLHWYGLIIYQALLGGFILALSSTAIVLKILQDSDDLDSPSGLKMTGILLFQDAVIIPAIILLPFINQLREAPALPVLYKVLFAFASVIVIFILCKKLLPQVMVLILKLRIPDLLMVTVFVFLFGVALIAHQLGISLAMGAFIVGVAISESDFAHQINTEIIPSRYIFNSIFFISIGMFVNVSFFVNNFPAIILATAIIISVKITVIVLLFVVSRQPINVGVMTAFGLAHIGEFSFILLKVAQEHTLFYQDTQQFLLSAALLSMFSVPFALKLGKRMSRLDMFKQHLPSVEQKTRLNQHTIIAGYGVNGQNIARILKLLNIPYAIVEMNPATVKKHKALGEPIRYGNIDRRENLIQVGIKQASLLVIAINDIDAAKRTAKFARDLNPEIKIIVRVNYLAQVENVYHFGADLVLSQDMETSLIFIHHILKFYNMPDHISRIQTNLLRKEHYRFFFKKEAREAWKIAIVDFIEQDNELFFISPYSKHVGKSISQLAPFKCDEPIVIGVIRQNQVIVESIGELILEGLDTIIFSGNHALVYEALTWMETNN